MYGPDESVDGWAIVGAVAPEAVDQDAIWVDDEVAAELERVFGGPGHPTQTVLSEELDVLSRRSDSPDAPDRAATKSERVVGGPVGVDEQLDVELMFATVGRKVGRVGEGDEDDVGVVSEVGEAVAHGARVCCAGQSMNVSVENQDHCPTAMVGY